MKKISLLALDIGGTLLRDDNTISEEDLLAIKKCKEKGIKIALVTAREYSSTKYISKLIGCDYGVFSNGSHLIDLNDLRTISCSFIKRKAVLDIYDYCKRSDLYIHLNQEFCEVSDRMEYFNLKHHILNETYPDELKSSCFLIKNLRDYIILNDITKIVIVSEKSLDKVIEDLKPTLDSYDLFITEHNKNLNEHIINKTINYIEIGSEKDTKASGLNDLIKLLGIKNDEVLVIGDGDNDVELLKSFKNSACMSNGKEESKNISSYVTTNDNNNNGVSEAINHFVK